MRSQGFCQEQQHLTDHQAKGLVRITKKPPVHMSTIVRLHARVEAACQYRISSVQSQYSLDIDERVRRVPMFQPDQLVYIERLLLGASLGSNAKKMVKTSYNKLMVKTMIPLHIVNVQPNTLISNEYSVHKTVSIDHVTLLTGYDHNGVFRKLYLSRSAFLTGKSSCGKHRPHSTTRKAENWIVGYEELENDLCSKFRWYWYLGRHDTVQPATNVSQYYVHCDWKEKPGSNKRRKSDAHM